jgi:hypothetical protein
VPIQVTCPSCSSSFKAPDSASGKRAKCPKCNGVIDIPGGVPAAEILDAEEVPAANGADEYEVEPPSSGATDEVRRPCPLCGELISPKAVKCRYCGEVFDQSMVGIVGGTADMRDPRWEKVRTGVALVYYSVIVILLAVILMVIIGGVMGAMEGGRPDAGPSVGMMIVFGIAGIVMLCAGIASLVGYVMCAYVPEVSGAKKYITGSLFCMVINFMCGFISGAAGIEALSALGSLFSLGGWVMFILFIRHTAEYLGNQALASSAGRFLIFAVVMFVGAFGLGIALAVAETPALLGILGLAAIIGGLIGFVWYVNMLQKLMTTIDERLGTK